MKQVIAFLASTLLILGVGGVLAACGPSPKATSSALADRFPKTVGVWELDERIELSLENASSYGHITLIYEGSDERQAYITLDTYATENAADVQMVDFMREWALDGVRLERQQIGRERVPAGLTQGGMVAYIQDDNIIVGISLVFGLEDETSDIETILQEETTVELLETIIAIINNL